MITYDSDAAPVHSKLSFAQQDQQLVCQAPTVDAAGASERSWLLLLRVYERSCRSDLRLEAYGTAVAQFVSINLKSHLVKGFAREQFR